MRRAIYPGTFDPPTNGHLDLIRRGAALFDELLVLVAVHSGKQPIFTLKERVALIRGEVESQGMGNVSVADTAGLVSEFAVREGYDAILRGMRTTADFVGEYQMALTNRSLAPEVETVFVVPSLEWSYLSSSLIREVVGGGGDVSAWVPGSVAAALGRKLGHS